MPLNKPSGNMYPRAYTWNPLAGECPHECGYCYVQNDIAPMLKRCGNDKYYGELCLVEKEFKVPLVVPDGFVIFVQSCGDLFANLVPDAFILKVLNRIREFPQTTFLLQTKNPERFFDFEIPENCILGTTIESNRPYSLTKAPDPELRWLAMKKMPTTRKVMVSIEPVMDFDLNKMLIWFGILRPSFVSIGADSGHNNLPEPSPTKLNQLLWQLELFTEVRRKANLSRLLPKKQEASLKH